MGFDGPRFFRRRVDKIFSLELLDVFPIVGDLLQPQFRFRDLKFQINLLRTIISAQFVECASVVLCEWAIAAADGWPGVASLEGMYLRWVMGSDGEERVIMGVMEIAGFGGCSMSAPFGGFHGEQCFCVS